MKARAHAPRAGRLIAGVGVTFIAASFIALGSASTPAAAAQGTPDQDEQILFGWYSSPPTYAGGSPQILTDEALSSQGFTVFIHSAEGGAPAPWQGDIKVTHSHSGSDPIETVSIDASKLPVVQQELNGAAVTDALVLPKETSYNQTGCSLSLTPSLQLAGSTFMFTRPELRKGCAKYDSGEYEFQVAVLTDNYRKYLVDFTLNFGIPTEGMGGSVPEPDPTTEPFEEEPVETAEPEEEQTEEPEPKETSEPEEPAKEESPKPEASSSDSGGDPLMPIVIGGGFVLVAVAVAAVWFRHKKAPVKADAKGNLLWGAPNQSNKKGSKNDDE